MNEKIKELIDKELENFKVEEKEINEVKKEIIKFLEDNFSDYITINKNQSTLYDDSKRIYFYFNNSNGREDIINPYIVKLNDRYYFSNGYNLNIDEFFEKLEDMIPYLAHMIAYYIKKEKAEKRIIIEEMKQMRQISFWKFWTWNWK